LAYEFGLPPNFTTSIDFYPPVKPVQSHIDVSHAIVSKWVSFAHSLDPNEIAGTQAELESLEIDSDVQQSPMFPIGPVMANQRRTWSGGPLTMPLISILKRMTIARNGSSCG
jgi:hypothetical protein